MSCKRTIQGVSNARTNKKINSYNDTKLIKFLEATETYAISKITLIKSLSQTTERKNIFIIEDNKIFIAIIFITPKNLTLIVVYYEQKINFI